MTHGSWGWFSTIQIFGYQDFNFSDIFGFLHFSALLLTLGAQCSPFWYARSSEPYLRFPLYIFVFHYSDIQIIFLWIFWIFPLYNHVCASEFHYVTQVLLPQHSNIGIFGFGFSNFLDFQRISPDFLKYFHFIATLLTLGL